MKDKKIPLLQHLAEFRKRFLVALVAVIIGSIVSYLFVDEIFKIITRPISTKLIFTAPAEAFIITLEIAIVCGIILASPVILYQVWKFASIAIKKTEKKPIYIYMPVSLILFILGVLFAYFIVAPIGLRFLLSFGGESLQPLITISKYISYIAMLVIGFGVVFELPLVMLFLSRIGIISSKTLSRNRAYFIVGIFIVAAILTPPDVFTQLLLAVPLIILYEISILVVKLSNQ